MALKTASVPPVVMQICLVSVSAARFGGVQGCERAPLRMAAFRPGCAWKGGVLRAGAPLLAPVRLVSGWRYRHAEKQEMEGRR